MTKKNISFVLLFLFFITILNGQNKYVEGFVFIDKNKNGEWDKGEKKLHNILVSNGDTIVKTDKNGFYKIEISPKKSVFPILPNNFQFNGQGIVSRNYFNKTENDIFEYNFALYPTQISTIFTAAIVGDVQVKDETELHYAQSTIFSELSNSKNIDFAIFMGDLSNDNDSILLKVRDAIEILPFQSWNIIGNHDLDKEKPRTSSFFNEKFGSDVFAFMKGQICFIGLNNVEWEKGKISDAQLRFLKNLLSYLPKSITPIISLHIPLYSTANREELLRIIGERKCLILSAHSHNVSRHFWNEWVYEWGVGASCGSWWTGEINQNSIPLALQQCGTPRNYFLLNVNKNRINLKFKGIDLDESHQMDIWIKGQNKADDSIPSLQKLPEKMVVANIYAGSDSTIVEYSINESDWTKMKQTPMIAPATQKIIEWNKKQYYPTKNARKLPLRNRVTKHIWTTILPDLPNGFYQLKIRASDKYGSSQIEQTKIFYIHNL